ncbi:1,4-alpha-glucan branching protein GlgB [Oxyplasma meridianum]|uniref:1,4-alpha-glucan branching enzyme GlgB n=1 Tax=Oxyplasma meridianum TaxID=3073602 RepID=A0AAX4NE75_9ARCH
MNKEEFMKQIRDMDCDNPFQYLGPHTASDGKVIIRAYLPIAKRSWVIFSNDGTKIEMKMERDRFFFLETSDKKMSGGYRIAYSDESGYVNTSEDPYAFQPSLSEFDLYLFKKGELYKSYETMGSHIITINGVKGVRFIVWAPNARSVSVVGNFNHWTQGMHPMANVSQSGLWELFVPGLGENELYKFAIKSKMGGDVSERTDPYAFYTEKRPRTASIVTSLDHSWNDQGWVDGRDKQSYREMPMAIYEVHLGSWKRGPYNTFLNYREIADHLVEYVKKMGFTHIEIMPITEYPLDESWGYQVVNYYAPTSRYGDVHDFMYFMEKFHENGIGVILDWVPAHFPDDRYGLSMYDGTHLYDHADPRMGKHPDWGTRIFNYGRNEVRNFLISSALFWIDKYHVDGIRIDAVSSMLYLDYSRKPGEWIPNRYGGRENLEAIAFIRELNTKIHEYFPGIVSVAEESTAWGGVTSPVELGGLGFDYKWNMGWMHDTLGFFSSDPIYRKFDLGKLTFSMWYAFSEKYILPISHDEIVHGKGSIYQKMPGDNWQKLANIRLLFSYMFAFPGKKIIFMGNEFGQIEEWNALDQLKWDEAQQDERKKIVRMITDLAHIYGKYSEMHQLDCNHRGFEWIDFNDSNNTVISFMRMDISRDKEIIAVFNMTPVPRSHYVIGVNRKGFYKEIFNSDSEHYGGSGVGNYGGVYSNGNGSHGRPDSIEITLPPLGSVFFLREE